MAKTISSGSSTTLLCPVAEFLKRVDQTIVAQLCGDDSSNPLEQSDLPANANLLAALIDACGEVESVALMGKCYEAVDLLALAVVSPPTFATGKLWRIISDVAWVYLWERRPNKNVPPPPSLERSQAWLEALAMGKRIFGFSEVEEAGLPEIDVLSPREVEQRNGAVEIAGRLFGRRGDRELSGS